MGLYWYDYLALQRTPDAQTSPGLDVWTSIYKVFREIMVDRTGATRSPLQMIVDPSIRIPDPESFPAQSFEECCVERASELLELSESTKKPLIIMFSGGIDSTAI